MVALEGESEDSCSSGAATAGTTCVDGGGGGGGTTTGLFGTRVRGGEGRLRPRPVEFGLSPALSEPLVCRNRSCNTRSCTRISSRSAASGFGGAGSDCPECASDSGSAGGAGSAKSRLLAADDRGRFLPRRTSPSLASDSWSSSGRVRLTPLTSVFCKERSAYACAVFFLLSGRFPLLQPLRLEPAVDSMVHYGILLLLVVHAD